MSTLKPYREYKDSGVRWLSAVPSHWDVVPLGRNAAFRNGLDYKDIEVPHSGYPVIGSGGEFRRASAYLYDGESVLFGRKGTINKPLYMSGPFWTVDTMFYTEIRRSALLPKFLYYFALHIPYGYFVTSTALPSMTQGDLRAASMGLPQLDEQRAIASFLDNETAEIDAFIADQQELIQLLNERRKGLLDAVTVTADGVSKVRLRYLFTQSRECGIAGAEILSVYREHGVVPKASRNDNFNKTPDDVSRYLVVRPGWLVVNKMKAWQGSLGVSQYHGIVSPDYEVLKPTSNLLLEDYVHYLLRSPRFISEYALRSVGIRPSQWRLYWDQLGDIAIPVPHVDEQRKIAARIMDETAEIDAAIADAKEAIELSKERRAALISAAVTGKIDVRDHPAAKGAA